MDGLSVSEARANLKALMDRVVADRVPVSIRRRGGQNVIMVRMKSGRGWRRRCTCSGAC